MVGAIRIGDPVIEVRLRRNARARRMVLRVGQTAGGTVLTLPMSVPLAAAKAFVSDHEGWLRRQLAAQPGGVPVRDGTMLPFGDAELSIRAATGRRLIHVDNVLHVPGPPSDLPGRVAVFMRAAAREACVAATDRHAATLDRQPRRVTLRDPRSRWGSCTATGGLMFSWRLVMAPCAVLDYVVAHEVAHLREMNHSVRFWAVVKELCPEFDVHRDWLRRHGAGLHGYDFARSEAA